LSPAVQHWAGGASQLPLLLWCRRSPESCSIIISLPRAQRATGPRQNQTTMAGAAAAQGAAGATASSQSVEPAGRRQLPW
jgi:hypothetical protein